MKNKLFAISITLVVVVVIIGGFWLVGSPQEARKEKFDQSRAQNLQSIYYAIDSYYQINKVLPESLALLQKQPNYYVNAIIDPVSRQPYEYLVKDATTYDLCAVFDTTSTETNRDLYGPYGADTTFWQHQAGRTCFTLTVPLSANTLTPGLPLQKID